MTRHPAPQSKARRARLWLALLALPASALATNGMLLEGYGPVATGMGGAATAFDNGLAAATNNPATLALGADGQRMELALGLLGPRVSSRAGGTLADSAGTRYVMPALGWGDRSGRLSYGLAVFAQGGMGTDYGADSFLAMGSGDAVRSELGVGRVMLPLAFQATPDLALGASLDLVWASLDMKMAASGAQLAGMVTAAQGPLAMALPPLAGAPWARVDFSDRNDFTGAAKATGWAAKVGLVYSLDPSLRVGASHHFASALKDLRTGPAVATLSAIGGFADRGRITVVDFQMPAQTTVGVAWQATSATLLAADLKRIGWAQVMDSFRLRYDSAGLGGSVSFEMAQRWKNQTVLQLGATHRVNARWVLRAGANLASNPAPDATVNPLFPAIVENQFTAGAGVSFGPRTEFNASMAYAPKVSVQTPSGVTVSHRQFNLQAMLTQRF